MKNEKSAHFDFVHGFDFDSFFEDFDFGFDFVENSVL
jgi:hypothetical protein